MSLRVRESLIGSTGRAAVDRVITASKMVVDTLVTFMDIPAGQTEINFYTGRMRLPPGTVEEQALTSSLVDMGEEAVRSLFMTIDSDAVVAIDDSRYFPVSQLGAVKLRNFDFRSLRVYTAFPSNIAFLASPSTELDVEVNVQQFFVYRVNPQQATGGGVAVKVPVAPMSPLAPGFLAKQLAGSAISADEISALLMPRRLWSPFINTQAIRHATYVIKNNGAADVNIEVKGLKSSYGNPVTDPVTSPAVTVAAGDTVQIVVSRPYYIQYVEATSAAVSSIMVEFFGEVT